MIEVAARLAAARRAAELLRSMGYREQAADVDALARLYLREVAGAEHLPVHVGRS